MCFKTTKLWQLFLLCCLHQPMDIGSFPSCLVHLSLTHTHTHTHHRITEYRHAWIGLGKDGVVEIHWWKSDPSIGTLWLCVGPSWVLLWSKILSLILKWAQSFSVWVPWAWSYCAILMSQFQDTAADFSWICLPCCVGQVWGGWLLPCCS
jgi:hypothetical protein